MTSQDPSPYETDPTKIPSTDLYADCPLYGRYGPKSGDFQPLPEHVGSDSPESVKYWETLLSECNDSTTLYKNELEEAGRDVFAIGGVIIKSGHLHAASTRDFSFNDANEVAATALAREPLAAMGIKVPEIYFAGKIKGRDVLIQERIPGVGLTVAHPYLSIHEMNSFKEQAREALRCLAKIKPPPQFVDGPRSYVVSAPDPVQSQRIRQQEADILLSSERDRTDPDRCFMHNDFTESNCIVNDGKIVGLVDWEMAGFFSWKTARDVHVNIRTPQRESYARFEGQEKYEGMLRRLFFWKDLYDTVELQSPPA